MEESSALTVSVSSFSYRSEIPHDEAKNGGGFVFDCRALHNPGCYTAYKNRTGKDTDVAAFLQSNSPVAAFLDSAEKLVALSIQEYVRRSYQHLAVDFGCTDGQHHSVYCAEAMAQFIKDNFAHVHVELKHLELEKNA